MTRRRTPGGSHHTVGHPRRQLLPAARVRSTAVRRGQAAAAAAMKTWTWSTPSLGQVAAAAAVQALKRWAWTGISTPPVIAAVQVALIQKQTPTQMQMQTARATAQTQGALVAGSYWQVPHSSWSQAALLSRRGRRRKARGAMVAQW
jgi:hypothetical protein